MLDDLPQIVRLIAALAFVLALMGGLTVLLRKLGLAESSAKQTGDRKRLKIIESIPLDHRRKLVLIQRDDRQHLVILGANSEIVVESNIPGPH